VLLPVHRSSHYRANSGPLAQTTRCSHINASGRHRPPAAPACPHPAWARP